MCAGCHDEMNSEGIETPNAGKPNAVNTRKSKRQLVKEYADKGETVHTKDCNGCTHTDQSTFNSEQNPAYLKHNYRMKIPEETWISTKCLTCGGDMLNLMYA